MNLLYHLLLSMVCGVVFILVTYITGYISKGLTQKPDLAAICSTWNKYHIMEINLFLAGILFYFIAILFLDISFKKKSTTVEGIEYI
jgi:hypothetical protein